MSLQKTIARQDAHRSGEFARLSWHVRESSVRADPASDESTDISSHVLTDASPGAGKGRGEPIGKTPTVFALEPTRRLSAAANTLFCQLVSPDDARSIPRV